MVVEMRTFFAGLLTVAIGAASLIIGCSTSQQMTAFKTLSSAEATVNAANDAYQTLVIKGSIPTNDVPKVSKLYNDFQVAELVALDAVQFNTNAVAPPALAVEGQDFVNLLTSLESKGKHP